MYALATWCCRVLRARGMTILERKLNTRENFPRINKNMFSIFTVPAGYLERVSIFFLRRYIVLISPVANFLKRFLVSVYAPESSGATTSKPRAKRNCTNHNHQVSKSITTTYSITICPCLHAMMVMFSLGLLMW